MFHNKIRSKQCAIAVFLISNMMQKDTLVLGNDTHGRSKPDEVIHLPVKAQGRGWKIEPPACNEVRGLNVDWSFDQQSETRPTLEHARRSGVAAVGRPLFRRGDVANVGCFLGPSRNLLRCLSQTFTRE